MTDAEGKGLEGGSVTVKGTVKGVLTNASGAYTIDATASDVLVFTYVGYRTQEVAVGDQKTINVTMSEDFGELDEVVVVGYGTRKKSHNTGAIAQVRGTEIASIQANRVDDALAGKLAGVLIQNQDGAPGADPKIQVRAASSISGDSNPLIVVDGYPISGSLATINPNDIESLEVLKDAASAAIYGSRGANGVILVTTKKGKTGKARLSYNAYVSTSNRYVRDVEQLKTAGEWADELDAGFANGTYDDSELDPAIKNYRINAYRNSPDVVGVEDWLFQTGYSTNHDLSISGGTEDINYFASVGYLQTQGIAITQGFERYNARMNLNAKLSKRLSTGLNINGFVGDRDIVGHDVYLTSSGPTAFTRFTIQKPPSHLSSNWISKRRLWDWMHSTMVTEAGMPLSTIASTPSSRV
ncbi:MAG: SusC/RagA family TonB-linked outer membrane protein [Bacteroidia bacterium]